VSGMGICSKTNANERQKNLIMIVISFQHGGGRAVVEPLCKCFCGGVLGNY
jgi:hypothetical protein